VHSCIQFGDCAAALGARHGFLAQFSEELVEVFHALRLPVLRGPPHAKAPATHLGNRRFESQWLLRAEQVDHEGEGATGETVSSACGAVREVGRADELAASADLHTRDALLPTGNEASERKVDALAAAPARVELFAGLEIDAQVVHVNCCAGCGFCAGSLFDVDDHELCGLGALIELDFWLGLR